MVNVGLRTGEACLISVFVHFDAVPVAVKLAFVIELDVVQVTVQGQRGSQSGKSQKGHT
jgi:hypothetical protein